MRHAGFAMRAALVALVAGLAGCGEQNTYVAPPPPKVDVALPLKQAVTRYLEATGNTVAVNTANLVARVQGFVQGINYRDGDVVKKGTTLFVIEPEPYRLKLQQSQAAEEGAQAALRQAEADFQRQSDLASRQVASRAALDNATAARESAQANLLQAKVNTKLAAINVDYTQVTAPFDGVVSARQVSIGELVGAGSPTVLATIVQSDPIYVSFSISEREVQHIRAEMQRRGVTLDKLGPIPVEVGLQSESGYPHRGTLDYIAPTVSQATGTLTLRAVLANPSGALLPGYFVRVRIPGPQAQEALLVPDIALGSDQSGRYVLVVNGENVVEQRKVEIGPASGDLRVIDKGLKPDDRVVVGGALRAVVGQKVDPQLRQLTPSGSN
ncbi:MAG TPA: efflux RND transporter periplasmic adaptor subunit [Xanthobacteraceae bacterium]|nr:efflux RND transporter periplasmic adaptor subunit [Xanthobacteraceae bacterium]